jgi:hypothetical protein
MEFKKNRQAVILEGIKSLVPPVPIVTQGVLSDAKAKRAIEKNVKAITTRANGLKLGNAGGPPYTICEGAIRSIKSY